MASPGDVAFAAQRAEQARRDANQCRLERDEARRWASFWYGAARAALGDAMSEEQRRMVRLFAATIRRWGP